MKILLISYNRIGDTILSTGLIDHLLKILRLKEVLLMLNSLLSDQEILLIHI